MFGRFVCSLIPLLTIQTLGERPHARHLAAFGLEPRHGSLLAREELSQPLLPLTDSTRAITVEDAATAEIQDAASAEIQRIAEVFVPMGAMLAGVLLLLMGHNMAGLLAIYFGAQPGFSLYMKVVLSDAEISRELGIQGVPAAFLLTAVQQTVAFAVLALAMLVLWPTQWRYMPKPLTTSKDWTAVFCFSLSFAANIGLNNLSLSFLPLSLNLIIRSCLPLVTLAVQLVASQYQTGNSPRCSPQEVGLMAMGVLCAGFATLAKSEATQSTKEWEHLHFGIIMCCLSVLAAALNLVFVAALGQKMELNPLDSAWYMALPAALCLLLPGFLITHPVDWPGFGNMTDWQVLIRVFELSPSTIGRIVLSGVFGVGYNILQFQLVQSLSATHAAFAGNFNKAATIMLSICFGLEILPRRPWNAVMLCAILGNIVAFAGYSFVREGCAWYHEATRAVSGEAGAAGVGAKKAAPAGALLNAVGHA